MLETGFGVVRGPRNLVFGAGQRLALPQYAKTLGQRALLVTDERMAAETSFIELVRAVEATGVSVSVFAGVEAELPADCIAAGVEQGTACSADLIVGIGGGSCLDAAKIIALLLAHGGDISDYYGEFKVPGPVLPLIALPTTAGTGSEVTPVAVVSDKNRAVKVGIASPHLIPHTAICDPELTYGCPPRLTAASGADALTHAIEAFTTARRKPETSTVHDHVFLGKNTLSDLYALEAIRLIGGSLAKAVSDGTDQTARADMMRGATLAGLAFGTAGTAAAHAVQYPVGALTHTAHGLGVAAMMPYVMEFNLPLTRPEMAEIAVVLGLPVGGLSQAQRAAAAVDGVAELFAGIGIPTDIRSLGLAEDKLEWIAELALAATRLVKNNPRPLDTHSMQRLVQAAYRGDRASLRNDDFEPEAN
ncbi:alcohol dehydrogenase [Devosia subaequoris]|uniref:Alcohol dehydrogenase n=1 Tax=Devosia subaequoris TaxID=395930 RepID=A0A7W6NDK3_9HYPH|nr:iron-containing alcohol dehydrogenase [Devosia subaequoris]MBB4053846.1 alcohol dehydrogenase [Devosia subaequoris]MCP1211135.1 iron-containing alcohol dehydrogenase [Devosia subaequoris]